MNEETEVKKARPHGPQEYKGRAAHDWEPVGPSGMTRTFRLRVPGGWLYRDFSGSGGAMAFVPVP